MKKTRLGELEEFVLLAVILLKEDAYGVEIRSELERRLDNSFSIGSIQTSLKRLQEKGFLDSEFGEATQKRGGKRKRIYVATPNAHKTIAQLKEIRSGLYTSLSLIIEDLSA